MSTANLQQRLSDLLGYIRQRKSSTSGFIMTEGNSKAVSMT